MSPDVRALFELYAWASLGVLGFTLIVRVLFGLGPSTLVRSRGYELPPLRAAVHATHALVWVLAAAAAAISFRHGRWYYYDAGDPHLYAALTAAAACLALGLFAAGILRAFVIIPDNRPPDVTVTDVALSPGIDRDALDQIGREQFPECLAYGHRRGLWLRRLFIPVGVLTAVAAGVTVSDWGRDLGMQPIAYAALAEYRAFVPALPGEWTALLGLSSALATALLLLTNFRYTLFTLPRSIAAGSIFAVGLLYALLLLQFPPESLLSAIGVLGVAWSFRFAFDLQRASRFVRLRDVTEPIRLSIEEVVDCLPALRRHPQTWLPALDDVELSERISRGCRNVEEADPLVTRNLARFLSLVQIEYEPFAAATLRFLTVRRYLTYPFGGGTYRALQRPNVPMWNELMFPLLPPTGYRYRLDPLWLDSSWDIVSVCGPCGGSGRVTCGGCGGSGQVQRSETTTTYNNGQSQSTTRTRWETCSGCGGSGRVVCGRCSGCGRVLESQVINTEWQCLTPTHCDPPVLIPELMDGAEERVHYRVSLIEDREPQVLLPDDFDIDETLAERLCDAAQRLAYELDDHASRVEALHDGRLYRADFRVAGFHTMRIRFRRLPGKVGWFFGARPEFHFPALPLSWSMVGTTLFVGPFLIAVAFAVGLTLFLLLDPLLPKPY